MYTGRDNYFFVLFLFAQRGGRTLLSDNDVMDENICSRTEDRDRTVQTWRITSWVATVTLIACKKVFVFIFFVQTRF